MVTEIRSIAVHVFINTNKYNKEKRFRSFEELIDYLEELGFGIEWPDEDLSELLLR